MSYKLRDYQEDAINACFAYLENNPEKNPILSLPTGAGKSIIVSSIFQNLLQYSNTRGLCLTHVKELIVQNHSKMPVNIGAGIYSAGVGKRNVHNRIIFCGIQSVYKKANLFSPVNLIVIDECHLLSPNQETMYGQFINDLKSSNHNMRVIGLTATPYRTNDGLLTDCTLFDDIAYDLPMTRLIDDGYLAKLTSKKGSVEAQISNMGNVAGEYNLGMMAKEFDQDHITRAAVHEIVTYGSTRRKWLVFCSSVQHCYHVQEYMKQYNIPTAIITGDMKKDDRDLILKQYSHGVYKCLLNYGVLTTGFDEPQIDLIALLRSTKSTSLYVQMLGRGMRPVYADGFDLDTRHGRFCAMAAGSKKDGCLVLDYGQNVVTHGPVDKITIEKKYNKEKGLVEDRVVVQPTKMCPECGCDNHIQARSCPECGYDYPVQPKHEQKASDAAILSVDIVPEWFNVEDVLLNVHKKQGKPDSLKVSYICGMTVKNEWICIEHDGYAKNKARQWWSVRGIGDFPDSVKDAIKQGVKRPMRISVKKEGKYDRIIGYDDNIQSENQDKIEEIDIESNHEGLTEMQQWTDLMGF